MECYRHFKLVVQRIIGKIFKLKHDMCLVHGAHNRNTMSDGKWDLSKRRGGRGGLPQP